MGTTPRKWGFGPHMCRPTNVLGEDGCAVVGEDALVHLSGRGNPSVTLSEMIDRITADCLHQGIATNEFLGKEKPL